MYQISTLYSHGDTLRPTFPRYGLKRATEPYELGTVPPEFRTFPFHLKARTSMITLPFLRQRLERRGKVLLAEPWISG